MSKTRRLILIASVAHLIIGLALVYYLASYPLAAVAAVAVDFALFRLVIASGSHREVAQKIIRPVLFLLLAEAYYFASTAVTSTRLLSFIVLFGIAVGWHAILCTAELSTERFAWTQSVEAAVLIFISTNITSLLIANWSLPLALVLGLYLTLNVFIALFWLARLAKNVNYLALIWGLAAAELVWISSHWIIFYQLPILKYLIGQNSLLITTLAYSWGGIYAHYKNQQLSRRIIFEYLFVLLIVVVVLLILTRWRVI